VLRKFDMQQQLQLLQLRAPSPPPLLLRRRQRLRQQQQRQLGAALAALLEVDGAALTAPENRADLLSLRALRRIEGLAAEQTKSGGLFGEARCVVAQQPQFGLAHPGLLI
jgi:hypothetical protein